MKCFVEKSVRKYYGTERRRTVSDVFATRLQRAEMGQFDDRFFVGNARFDGRERDIDAGHHIGIGDGQRHFISDDIVRFDGSATRPVSAGPSAGPPSSEGRRQSGDDHQSFSRGPGQCPLSSYHI